MQELRNVLVVDVDVVVDQRFRSSARDKPPHQFFVELTRDTTNSQNLTNISRESLIFAVFLPSGQHPSGSMDDDDDVPPLEATRRKPDAKQEEGINGKRGEKSERTVDPTDGADGQEAVEERNEVAEAMMQRALAAREQKRKETDESRRKVDGFGGGLKKGFLSSKPQAGNRVWIVTESLTSHCSRSLGTRCCMDFFVSVCVAISIAVPFCSKSGILALTCDIGNQSQRQRKGQATKRC